MQDTPIRRAYVTLFIAGWLAACSASTSNPYESLPGAPLVRAYLHTATLMVDDVTLIDRLQNQGWRYLSFPSNYPDAARYEALLWGVPEQVAAQHSMFAAPEGTGGPNVRVLIMPTSQRQRADPAVERDFFRNVLGTQVPQWPAGELPAGARVQVWTYVIENVAKADEILRKAGIPVTSAPVAFKSPYLGDHRSMAIRAPDGTVVELFQGSAN
jgi:hypothetical protein